MATIEVKRHRSAGLRVTIEGVTPLVMHKFGEKAARQLEEKKAGNRSRMREACVPEEEFEAAIHRLPDGRPGVPVTALKKSIVTAGHKDLGIPRTAIMQGLFISAVADGLVPLESPEPPKMRTDTVRVANGNPDIRYRPEFQNWRVTLDLTFDQDKLTAESVVNLIERAGYGVGIGEGRPEKGSGLEWGRFQVAKVQGSEK